MAYLLSHHPHLLTLHIQTQLKLPRYTLSTHVYSKLIFARLYVNSLSVRAWVLAISITFLLPFFVISILFLRPKHIPFHYSAADSCFFNPSVFPAQNKNGDSTHFSVSQPSKISLGNTTLLSTTTCIELTRFSDTSTTEHLYLHAPLKLSKKITVTAANPPQLQLSTDPAQPVSSKGNLLFSVSQADTLSSYVLRINEQQTTCTMADAAVHCPLESLPLKQGEAYTYSVERTYRDDTKTVLSGEIRLIDPLTLTPTTLQPNQTVFTPVSMLDFTANKPLSDGGMITLRKEDGTDPLPLTSVINETTLRISFPSELERGAVFKLIISDATAQDGAFQEQDLELNFTTSTGPKVTAFNLPSYKVGLNVIPRLSFDVEPSKDERNLQSVSLTSNGQTVASSVTVQGVNLSIAPNAPLLPCTRYTVSVTNALSNSHGIAGDSAWSTSFRTICQQTFSIGTSVLGRSITAYRFGSGPRRILFVGGTHGDEKSSVLTMQSWVDELEQKYDSIPGSFTVIVIPTLNPDGYARSRRTNANNVDLNRNFPSNDWSSAAYLPNNILLENGGGTQPLSEPESYALAQYVQSTSLERILTYHASGSVVIANESGNSASLASQYAAKSGFSSSTSAHEDGIFAYPTTGEFETWTHDALDVPTLLVELRGLGNNEIRSQSPAMWAMLQ